MSSRQDSVDDRLSTIEDKIAALQEQLEMLPDILSTKIQAHVGILRTNLLAWGCWKTD